MRRPVDYVAAGITGVLSHHRSGFDAYHMVNPHWDDGVSLDTIVGWLAEARSGVRRIQDYAQWCAPLRAHPVVPAGASSLALLPSQAFLLDMHTGLRIIYVLFAVFSPACRPHGHGQEHGAGHLERHPKLYGGCLHAEDLLCAGTRTSKQRWRAWTPSARACRRCPSSISGRSPLQAPAPSTPHGREPGDVLAATIMSEIWRCSCNVCRGLQLQFLAHELCFITYWEYNSQHN